MANQTTARILETKSMHLLVAWIPKATGHDDDALDSEHNG